MKTFYYYQFKPKNEPMTTAFVSPSEIKHLYDGDIKNHPRYKEIKQVQAKSLNEAIFKVDE